MELTREDVVRDAQDGRAKLAFGNPVLCMDWVKEIVPKYEGLIENLTEHLTLYEDRPQGGLNPVSDVSVLVAKLEHYMRVFE